MKALKSKLATELLSDPQARAELRTFLVSKGSATKEPTRSFVVRGRRGSGSIRIDATVVPKAAKTA